MLICQNCFAAPPRTLRFETINIDKTLNGETVQAIAQDKQGFLWIASENGLRRYDGYTITHYKSESNKIGGLADFQIRSLLVDTNGNLWVGTRAGLHLYDPDRESFIRYLPNDHRARGNGHLQINAMLGDGKGGIWIASMNGLQYFDIAKKSFKIYRNEPLNPRSINNDQINALAMSNKGELWIGTSNGVDKMLGKKGFEHFSTISGALDEKKRNAIQSLLFDKSNTLWVGSIGGLEAWRTDHPAIEKRRFDIDDGLAKGWVTTLFQDNQANLWVGTFEGLHLWDAAQQRFLAFRNHPDDPLSLPDNRISAQFQDRSGTMWVASWFSGLSYVDLASGGFSNYKRDKYRDNTLSSNAINAISGDNAGNIWVASNDGLNQFIPTTNQFQRFRPIEKFSDNQLRENIINDVKIGPQQRIWVGTANGLFEFKSNTKEFYRIKIFPDSAYFSDANFIRKIYPDKRGNLWLASRHGLIYYQPESRKYTLYKNNKSQPDSLSDDFVRAILEDRDGNIWVGTFNGLDLLNKKDGSFVHYRNEPNNPSSLSSNRITFLYQDRKFNIWVGTGAGLNFLKINDNNTVSFKRFSLHQKKEYASVHAILEGKSGVLWISNEHGIVQFDYMNEKIHQYSSLDGMAEGSYAIDSAYAADDGTFYFGSEEAGLTAFRSNQIHTNPYPPSVLITKIWYDDNALSPSQSNPNYRLKTPVFLADSIDLHHQARKLVFEFSAIHFSAPERNKFAYRLDGIDKNWIATDASARHASYNNLPPGNYVFRVRASNKDGVWNETGAVLRVNIHQVYWKTWWFISCIIFLASASIYSIYKSRIYSFTKQTQELERQVAVRTAEVIQQQRIVEQKNSLVEMQKLETERKNRMLEQQKYEVERQKENVELAHHNISVLSEIGRDITSTLDRHTILCNVYRHIHGLLDATSFVIYLMDDDQQSISIAFRVETGNMHLPTTVSLDDATNHAARCIREQREIIVALPRHLPEEAHAEHSAPLLSQIYAPLATGNRVLGVMSILSCLENAYGSREQLIFRTLCAYVAIALDNSSAYSKLEATLLTLREAQAQMVQQEKMASLGTLTAGVAHEINNPANFAHVGAQALASDLERFRKFLIELAGDDAEIEVLDSLNSRLDNLSRQVGTIIEGTTRIKNLVLDLRTFSRLDQAQKKTVAIGDSLMSTINLVRTQFALTTEIHCELEANPELECFPAELNQVFMNLIVNACQAIQSKLARQGSARKGLLRIRSWLEGGFLLISFDDEGDGIPNAIIAHIFEPFFTTKSVGEGTGLGLSISFGIIEKHHGSISVQTVEGQGSCFTIKLPLVEPSE